MDVSAPWLQANAKTAQFNGDSVTAVKVGPCVRFAPRVSKSALTSSADKSFIVTVYS